MPFRPFFLLLSLLITGAPLLAAPLLAAPLLTAPLLAAPLPSIPNGEIPGGLGINIHFTDALPGEMEMLAATGVKWIRMDWGWGRTERERGVYNWSEPDKLVAAMEKHDLRAVFVLSYGNKLYSPTSPATDEVRQAFARWAVAAVTRYQGRGILWEMWNEPNLFWTPKINAEDYVKLALVTGEAVKRARPDETFIGPAGAWMDFPFLEKLFQGGVLRYFDAVSVHPYRDRAPDSVAPDYLKLRALIDKYKPAGKEMPILAGEWGYSSSMNKMPEERQARFLSRQWLTNIASGVPLSVWYDWRDDGDDPAQSEHRYGLVRRPHFPNRTPAFDAKPSYFAAQALIRELRGFRFEKRLPTGAPEDWVLEFRRDSETRIAAWTAQSAGKLAQVQLEERRLTLPLSPAVAYFVLDAR